MMHYIMFNSFATLQTTQHILIIEDSANHRLSLRDYFGIDAEINYQIDSLPAQASLLMFIQAHLPDCLIMDMEYQQVTPAEWFKAFNELGLCKPVAIIVMADSSKRAKVQEWLRLGALDWIDTSALSPAYVQHVVHSALEKHILLNKQETLQQNYDISIRQLDNLNRLIWEREQLFQRIADSSPSGWWITDPQGNVIYVNFTWKSMTDLNENESLGTAWKKLIHPEQQEAILALWR